MKQKKIFILDGHPAASSLSRSLAETYAQSARNAGHDVRVAHLSHLEFDEDFGQGSYTDFKPLEPALEDVLSNLEWSNHLVLVSPMWWGGLPARLKGLIDRTFVPGRTFDTHNLNYAGMPSPMLTGRTARVILTSDTPGWFMRIAYRRALIWQLKGQILGFVGFKPAKFTWFSGASHPKPGVVEKWMDKVRSIGAQAA